MENATRENSVKSRLRAGRMTEAFKVTRDRDAWKVIIAYAKERGTRLIDEQWTSE